MKYYIYRHVRLDQNVPFYVGYGSIKTDRDYSCNEELYERAYDKKNRGPGWKGVATKTLYKIDIMMELDHFTDTCIKEVELISLYGRLDLGTGTLVNLTIGGDGSPGRVVSDETKRRIVLANKGRTQTPEAINNMCIAQRKLVQDYPERLDRIRSYAKNGREKLRVEVLDTKTGVVYKSITDAAKFLGVSRERLRKCLRGNRNNNTSMIIYKESDWSLKTNPKTFNKKYKRKYKSKKNNNLLVFNK